MPKKGKVLIDLTDDDEAPRVGEGGETSMSTDERLAWQLQGEGEEAGLSAYTTAGDERLAWQLQHGEGPTASSSGSDERLARQMQKDEFAPLEAALALLAKKKTKAPRPTANAYMVEVSKSARAACAVCNEKIAKGVVRCGVDRPGSMYMSWQHLKCTFFEPRGVFTSGQEVQGYSDLTSEQQDEVDVQVAESASKDHVDTIDPDELIRKDWDTPLDPPDTLLMPLLPYQKEGLGWMVNQEESSLRGGILADEMGK